VQHVPVPWGEAEGAGEDAAKPVQETVQPLIGNDTAQDMDQKIKKQRMRDMMVELRHLELDREVIKMLMDLVQ
jgi:hypothetical protein